MARITLFFMMAATSVSIAVGDTVILDEKFDQYSDDSALIARWVPRDGSGNNPAAVSDAGILTTDETLFPGVQGKAVDHVGGAVNQYEPTTGGPFPGSPVVPTATQSVFVSVDFFDGATGNERMTLGLRTRTGAAANIIEMGLYNSNSCDPTVCSGISPQNAVMTTPGFYPGTGYATRTQLFSAFNAPLLVQPDWQYFQLPMELDRTTDTDDIVGIADIGPGWHRYTATVTPESVTYTIDLFRDGVKNNMRDENGVVVGTGEQGVPDATMTFPVTLNAVGFDSLRIGGPSGLASAGTGATGYDNILLKLVDVVTPGNPTDFNGDGSVDAADYVQWRKNLGLMGGATQSQGDANGDGNVDNADFGLWRAAFGPAAAAAAGLGSASVPEPGTLALLSIAIAALCGAHRQGRD
jgi:hypothetical protein